MLKHASVIISLLLAGLYALGLTFQQGYLRELGLEETQFALSIDRTFFQGFVSAIDMGSKGLGYLFLSAAGIVLIAELGVFIGDWINRTDIYLKIKSAFMGNNSQVAESAFGKLSVKLFAYIGLAIVLYVLLLVALIMSGRSGEEYAKSFIKRTSKGVLHKQSIMLKSEEKPIVGYSIICSTLQCAYYVEGRTMVLNHRDIINSTDLGVIP
jgi:hypothetical protein